MWHWFFISNFPSGLKRQRNFTKIRPTLKKTHSAPYFGNFRHENYALLLTSRLYTELSWIPSFDAWMLVTSDRERLFLLKLVNLGRNKCYKIVNVIYSTLAYGITFLIDFRKFVLHFQFFCSSLFSFPRQTFFRDFWH